MIDSNLSEPLDAVHPRENILGSKDNCFILLSDFLSPKNTIMIVMNQVELATYSYINSDCDERTSAEVASDANQLPENCHVICREKHGFLLVNNLRRHAVAHDSVDVRARSPSFKRDRDTFLNLLPEWDPSLLTLATVML